MARALKPPALVLIPGPIVQMIRGTARQERTSFSRLQWLLAQFNVTNTTWARWERWGVSGHGSAKSARDVRVWAAEVRRMRAELARLERLAARTLAELERRGG